MNVQYQCIMELDDNIHRREADIWTLSTSKEDVIMLLVNVRNAKIGFLQNNLIVDRLFSSFNIFLAAYDFCENSENRILTLLKERRWDTKMDYNEITYYKRISITFFALLRRIESIW